MYHNNKCIECLLQLAYYFFNKGACFTCSLSAACIRLHWAKIYSVSVMNYKNVQALNIEGCDFPSECLIQHCGHPNEVIVVCIS